MDGHKKAIKAALSESRELRRKLIPFIVIRQGQILEIDFESCLKNQALTPSEQACIIWLMAIWTKRSGGHDLLKYSSAMDLRLRSAILNALKILWST